MRICFVGPSNSTHLKKWCSYFVSRGHEIHVISLTPDSIDNVSVYHLNSGVEPGQSDVRKIKYLFQAKKIRKIINKIIPDVINVHYATSYGTLMALSGIRDYILSVWGSDIYSFPTKSVLHKVLLQYSLHKANYLFSTSKAMAKEASKYTKKQFFITPFGVDVKMFTPEKRISREDNVLVIGTVKGLSRIYGIDYLLKAVALIKKKRPEINIQVRIAGKGPDETYLKDLALGLSLTNNIKWLGFISQEQAALEWANMDIAVVYSSVQESFGVAAVEAQASGVPVIISDVAGLMESTNPSFTSIVVKKEDEHSLAEGLLELINNPEKRSTLGSNGRQYVVDKYEYDTCFRKIENLFFKISKEKKSKQ